MVSKGPKLLIQKTAPTKGHVESSSINMWFQGSYAVTFKRFSESISATCPRSSTARSNEG
eukprot:1015050-Amorphochlora_amoeboformis.AAC.2